MLNLPPNIRRSKLIISGGLLCAVLLSMVASIAYVVGESVSHEGVTQTIDPFTEMTVEAKSAYVFDVVRGKVLFEKNASTPLPLASITKIALALVIAPVLEPSEHITISPTAAARSVDLRGGEVWRADELLDFTLLASSNAGAIALAEAAESRVSSLYPHPTGSSIVNRMNDLAHDRGLSDTHFFNPSGLDEGKTTAGALGSARDVAELFMYAARTSPELFAVTQQTSVQFIPISGEIRTAMNTNLAVADIGNVVLGKTGTTPLAGGNLGVIVEPLPGRQVAIVVLGGTESGRFDDIKRLVKAAETAVSRP